MVVFIAHDLHEPDRDYSAVIEYIKSLGSWCHLEESVWLIDSMSSPESIRDGLSGTSDDATYFVQRVANNWSSWGLSSSKSSWLKSEDRSW
jgi:hypothetical protein